MSNLYLMMRTKPCWFWPNSLTRARRPSSAAFQSRNYALLSSRTFWWTCAKSVRVQPSNLHW